MKTFLLSICILFSSYLLHAQSYIYDEYFIENCQCNSYEVRVPNPKVHIEFVTDTLKRILFSQQSMFEDYLNVDSFYYNEENQVIQKKSFLFTNNNEQLNSSITYSYTPSGKIFQLYERDGDNLLKKVETFQWDSQNRPLLFTQAYYKADTITEQYELRFKFLNDTLSLQEYWGKTIRSTSKRIYNKQGLIVKEYVEKKSSGSKVTYDYRYTKDGQLRSVHKVKVIGGDIPSFETYPYIYLLDASRKIEYSYDSKGRVSSYKTYNNIALDKIFTFEVIYKD